MLPQEIVHLYCMGGLFCREFSNIETAILSIPVFAEHVEFIACPVTRMEVGSAAATYRINVFA
ncbi:hypothetical protein T4E_4198 [Trichinella pseudospiralis]|uniref:Uncharacterized protein n=1 Tax=Trichinella pseudospiralis TaxID=6337 RepID=A0A0V0YFK7_TRIPS|nr:hypothetical protein T4E_4198 [Trichinella pseudospiralis]